VKGWRVSTTAATVVAWCVFAGVAQDSDTRRLAAHARDLLQILQKTKGPEELAKGLQAALREDKAEDFAERLRKRLEPHCLIRVTINPESRVKAARGEAPARLSSVGETIFLIHVANEAGVTHPLKVEGPQLLRAGKGGDGRWLEARVQTVSTKGLSGAKEEYVILRLTARGSGKREATLTFDVGQGTQDLGYRAEVPILFTVRYTPRLRRRPPRGRAAPSAARRTPPLCPPAGTPPPPSCGAAPG
jgi:hypothetical protein